jgi:hypothetical protein
MAYPAGAYPVPPQSQGMSGCAKAAIAVVVLALLLGGGCVFALALFGDEVVDRVDDVRQNGRRDTEITSCGLDEDGFMVAEIEITNRSSGRSQYNIVVTFRDRDGTESIEPAGVSVAGVEPGETTVVEARSTTAPSEELDCEILEAFRFSDGSGG